MYAHRNGTNILAEYSVGRVGLPTSPVYPEKLLEATADYVG